MELLNNTEPVDKKKNKICRFAMDENTGEMIVHISSTKEQTEVATETAMTPSFTTQKIKKPNNKTILYSIFLIGGYMSLFAWGMFVSFSHYYATIANIPLQKMVLMAYVVEGIGFILQIIVPLFWPPVKDFTCRMNISIGTIFPTLGLIVLIDWTRCFFNFPDHIYAGAMTGLLGVLHLVCSVMASYLYYIVGRVSKFYFIAFIIGTNSPGIFIPLLNLVIPVSHLSIVLTTVTLIMCAILMYMGLLACKRKCFKKEAVNIHNPEFPADNEGRQAAPSGCKSLSLMNQMICGSSGLRFNLILLILNYAIFLSCWPFIQYSIPRFNTANWFKILNVVLLPNIFIFLGNIFTYFCELPSKFHSLNTLLRGFLFTAFYLIMYYHGFSFVSVISDLLFMVINIFSAFLFGISSSYYISVTPILFLRSKFKSLASLLASFSIIFGIFLGAIFSALITNFSPRH